MEVCTEYITTIGETRKHETLMLGDKKKPRKLKISLSLN